MQLEMSETAHFNEASCGKARGTIFLLLLLNEYRNFRY